MITHVVSAFRRTVVVLALMTAAATAQQPPAPPATIVVSGMVTTANDVPLPRVRVVIPGVVPMELVRLGATIGEVAPQRTVLTDNAGRFAIPVAATASATLQFSKARYVTQSARISPRDLGLPGTELRVRLALGGSISGHVLDRSGGALMSATVTLRRAGADRNGPAVATTRSNDLGEYRFGGLEAGRYVATAVPAVVALGADFPDRQKVIEAATVDGPPVDVGIGTEVGNIVLTIDTPSEVDYGAGTRPPAGPDNTASVSGRVVGVDGLPIARVVVHAFRPYVDGRQVETDQTGRYRIDRLVPGEYTIAVRKYGFEGRQYGQEIGSVVGQPVTLKNGQSLDGLDMTLLRGGAIAGTIVDEFGEPVQGAAVSAVQLQPNPGGARGASATSRSTARTDDRGQYRLSGLLPGSYFIQAVVDGELPPGTGYLPRLYPGVAAFDQASQTKVQFGADIRGVDFAVAATATYRVAGRLFDTNGNPATGSVLLGVSERSGAVQTPARSATVARDGSFEFINVGPGDYVVQASGAATAAPTPGPPTARSLQFAMAYVSVAASDPPPVDLRMTPGATLTGRVRYEGLPPGPSPLLTIGVLAADGDRAPGRLFGARSADVRPDGSFATTTVFGPTLIQVQPQRNDWYLKSILFKGQDIVDTPFDFGDSGTFRDIDVVISASGATVTGRVTDDRAVPLRDYAVFVFPTFRDLWFGGSRWVKSMRAASLNGPFVVTGLPPGDYWVAATYPPDRDRPNEGTGGVRGRPVADVELLQSLSSRATRVSLGEGQTQDVTLRVLPR